MDMTAAYSGMKDVVRKEMALADVGAAVAQGFEGAGSDAVLEAAEGGWGFDLSACRTPVLLWHGIDDSDVPVEAGEYLASTIGPSCTPCFVEGENHTMIRRRWQRSLEELVQAASGTPSGTV